MDYIERNKAITAEIANNHKINKGTLIGSSDWTTTTSAGVFKSEFKNSDLMLALKQRTVKQGNIEMAFVFELAVFSLLHDSIPELQSEIPLFLSLLKSSEGQPVGILTEDFTQGGRYRIQEVAGNHQVADVSGKIKTLFRGDSELNDEEIKNMFFSLTASDDEIARRLGDVNKAMGKIPVHRRFDRFPVINRIFDDINSHTITLDHNL